LGLKIIVEKDLGTHLNWSDTCFVNARAKVLSREEVIEQSELLLCLEPPGIKTLKKIPRGTIIIGFLDPFSNSKIVDAFCDNRLTSISVEMVPRSTYAQKFDALSSQSSLAGYAAVTLAAERSNRIMPMMTTPAGTIKPLKVFVIGVGVAGLQAIATARRLGARVQAFDTRPVVEEQVKSLGAKFVKIDLGETGETENGYANALTEAQLQIQQREMEKVCINSDIIITSALLFGRPAPKLINTVTINAMASGSIIIDMAASGGGNVEGMVLNKETVINGVTIIAHKNLARCYPLNSSEMYASNLHALLGDILEKNNDGHLTLKKESDILQSCLITERGEIRNKQLRQHYKSEGV
ncbi:MAG: NAD(P) transhydrogenase subunit alpha, partial [Lentisphaeraceae bacterium]|nr:NAD(P) transhydrogenase subunit alpha [Lentisphaeraceae bacterium]